MGFNVVIDGVNKTFKEPTKVCDMFENPDYEILACQINNRLYELDHVVENDCVIKLLDITNTAASRMYRDTLRFLIIMALFRINPKAKISFNFSVSRSMYADVSNIGHQFGQLDLIEIESELKNIIEADYPIVRNAISKEEASNYYASVGWNDKVEVLKYHPTDSVHIYECNGYKNYMYGYMLKSTGFIKRYNLRLYSPGFIFQYPRSEFKGDLPEFKEERVFRQNLRIAALTTRLTNSESISNINNIVKEGKALEFINISEALISKQLVDLGNEIESNKDHIRLIMIAGPSSSGKTTFSNRLRIELLSRGIKPLMISMDDFYFSKDKTPKDENGNYDYEDINALNLELFDDVILKLIQGEEVRLPKFNFETGKTLFGEKVKIENNVPIMIEGIHGLDDRVAPSIQNDYKYRIFIAPVVQYKIDNHTPISISDARLVRRIVRDHEFRNTSAEDTLKTWASVRAGEFKWIYPYENNADFVFNSDLGYELSILRNYALPLLDAIPTTSDYYIDAGRLIKFLRYYLPISDKWVPCNSILREFIGDSIFYTDDKS